MARYFTFYLSVPFILEYPGESILGLLSCASLLEIRERGPLPSHVDLTEHVQQEKLIKSWHEMKVGSPHCTQEAAIPRNPEQRREFSNRRFLLRFMY